MCEVWKDEATCLGCGQVLYLDEMNEAGYCQECQALPDMPEGEEMPEEDEINYCPEFICPECKQEGCVCDRDIEKEPREPEWEEEYE